MNQHSVDDQIKAFTDARISPKNWNEPGVNALTKALKNPNHDKEIISFYQNICAAIQSNKPTV